MGKNLPIGVDLGSASLKMVQMRQDEGGLQLVAAGSVEVPRECRDDPVRRMGCHARAIRALLKTNVFKSRQCVISIPAESALVNHIRIPKMPQADVPGAVQAELSGKLPFPADDAIVRYVIAGDVYADGEAKQEVIVVATAKSTVEACLAMSRRAKLDVVGVNVEPCAIVECFARLFQKGQDNGRTTMYVDIGEMSTQVVLARGTKIAFARNLSVGGRWFNQVVAEGLHVLADHASRIRRDIAAGQDCQADVNQVYLLLDAPVADLTDKLTQCMRYHDSVFPNQGVERLVLLGGQAYDKRLCQAIAQRLNLAAHIGDPLVKVVREGAATLATGLDKSVPQPDWAVAVGLSLGAADAA